MRAQLDLSLDLIRRIARGNPANLPRFMVHDDTHWPWGKVQLDAKRRIHLRRSDFLAVVVPQIPTKPGLWLNANVQEFLCDLRPEHLGGGSDPRAPAKMADYRKITEDRRRCPECGGWMHDLHHVPGARFCQSCTYGTRGTEAAPVKPQDYAAIKGRRG